jgi:alkylation response protein AidB-like acyl-CoA dehydrogenase
MEGITSSAGVYEVPEELREIRATVRQIARDRVAPRAADIDADDS